MQFEYDPDKSAANFEKHGIDFVKAQQLWNDDRLLEVPATSTDKPRFLAVGALDGKHWAAVFTYRADKIRIISVRRARTKEIEFYESD